MLLSLFAYRNIHNLLVFGEAGVVDPSLQLFPVSSEKPPTPLECLVCALWSLILIIKLSLQHESWAASSGTLGSSALNQSNQVLHWRTFSPLFFQSGHLDSPLTHFHNYACPVIDGVKTVYHFKVHKTNLERFIVTTCDLEHVTLLLLSQYSCCFSFFLPFGERTRAFYFNWSLNLHRAVSEGSVTRECLTSLRDMEISTNAILVPERKTAFCIGSKESFYPLLQSPQCESIIHHYFRIVCYSVYFYPLSKCVFTHLQKWCANTRRSHEVAPGVSTQHSLAQPCSWQSEKDYHQTSFSISPPEVLLDFNPGGLSSDTPAATGQHPSDRIILSFSQLSL